MKANSALLITLVATCFAPLALAEHDDHSPGEEEHSHGEAHVHGAATVQLAFEGDVLEIRVLSPAINLLGFEGSVANEEQRKAGRAVREVLGQPDELFVVEGTRCKAQHDHTVISGLGDDAGSHDDHDDHHADDGHDEHHADDDHDEHHADDDHDKHHANDDHDKHHADDDHDEHHADDDHGADEVHSDIEAQYRFSCVKPERAESMRLPILSRFPGIESLDVQWIARGKQGAVTLEGGNQTVVFR